MLKVDAVLLEQILEINATHKAAVFPGNRIFVKIGRSLTDEPLQFIVQRIRASLLKHVFSLDSLDDAPPME